MKNEIIADSIVTIPDPEAIIMTKNPIVEQPRNSMSSWNDWLKEQMNKPKKMPVMLTSLRNLNFLNRILKKASKKTL